MMPLTDAHLEPGSRSELLRLLTPLGEQLDAAVAHPPRVAAEDWIGPAAEACHQLETELRVRLGVALAEVDRLLALVRSAA